MKLFNWLYKLFIVDSNELKNSRIKEYNDCINLCRMLLNSNDKFVILDTETTGLGENDIIIQIAILDMNGNEILYTNVRSGKPKRISSEASRIHGITSQDLKNAPSFSEIVEVIYELSQNKTFLIFNAEFDNRMLKQTCEFNNLRTFKIKAFCVQKIYSIFVGEWSDYYKDYKRQKLPNGNHNSKEDCLAVLKLIKEIANKEIMNIQN